MSEEQEEHLTTVLEKAFYEVLSNMGDDVRGVSWFSSTAEEYCGQS